jgi:hypothetical protein
MPTLDDLHAKLKANRLLISDITSLVSDIENHLMGPITGSAAKVQGSSPPFNALGILDSDSDQISSMLIDLQKTLMKIDGGLRTPSPSSVPDCDDSR